MIDLLDQPKQENAGLARLFLRPLGKQVSLRSPESLSVGHQLEHFDCDKSSLNEWLLRHARQAQASGFAKTFVVADDDRVAGYFSLTVGQVDALDAPERIRKVMGQYPAA